MGNVVNFPEKAADWVPPADTFKSYFSVEASPGGEIQFGDGLIGVEPLFPGDVPKPAVRVLFDADFSDEELIAQLRSVIKFLKSGKRALSFEDAAKMAGCTVEEVRAAEESGEFMRRYSDGVDRGFFDQWVRRFKAGWLKAKSAG